MIEFLKVIFHFCIGTLFLLFGIKLILTKGMTASKLLGMQFALIAFSFFISYYLTEDKILDHPYFFRTLSPPIYLIGPFSLLIQQFLLYPAKKFKLIFLLHFTPFVLHFAEYIPFYLSSTDVKINEIRFIIKSGNLAASTGDFGLIPMPIHDYLKGFSIIFYSIWLGFDLYSYSQIKGFKILKRNNSTIIKWVFIDFTMKILAVLFFLIYFLYWQLTGTKSSIQLIIYFILFSLNYLFEVFYLILHPQMLVGPTLSGFFTRKELEKISTTKKTVKKVYNPDHILKIQNLFETELVFLNPDLKIIDISERLKLSTPQISFSIKQAQGQSFPEFVNYCRLEFLKNELKYNPVWQKYTIEALAFEVGFKNRQTFHFACKSLYGLSASEFLIKIKNNN